MSVQIDSLVKMNADDASLKEILKDTCIKSLHQFHFCYVQRNCFCVTLHFIRKSALGYRFWTHDTLTSSVFFSLHLLWDLLEWVFQFSWIGTIKSLGEVSFQVRVGKGALRRSALFTLMFDLDIKVIWSFHITISVHLCEYTCWTTRVTSYKYIISNLRLFRIQAINYPPI